MRLRILADDLTGALECATAFAGQSPVGVHLQAPLYLRDAVQVVASDTRQCGPDSLEAALAPCLPWFTAGDLAFKKVDSLLRGNTFAELAWWARQGRFAAVVLAPAFPGQGRLTVDGQLCLVPPAGAPPVRAQANTVDVVAALQAQGLQAFHADHPNQPLPRPGQVMVLNATDDSALQYLASLHRHPDAHRWLWCGSGALATQMATQFAALCGAGVHPAEPGSALPAKPQAPGVTLVLTSSRHPVLRAQWAVLTPLENPAAHWVLGDLMDHSNLTQTEALQSLAHKARQVVQGHPRPAALVVVGGDTLLALCKASGATALRALPPVRPGWGHAQLQGGVWDGIRCFSRSGAFGDRHDVRDLLLQIKPVTL